MNNWSIMIIRKKMVWGWSRNWTKFIPHFIQNIIVRIWNKFACWKWGHEYFPDYEEDRDPEWEFCCDCSVKRRRKNDKS